MKRKLLSLLICLAMLCSLFTAAAAAAGEYPDMPDEGYWSYAALKAAVDNGLLKGREDGTLDPKGTLKRAEMAAIVNRAFGATDADDISGYTDVSLKAWYYGDVAKAVRMGTFRGSGSGLMEPEKPITREQAFTVIARSFLLEDGDPAVLEKFTDAGEISDYARGSIAALAAAGYVQGADGKLSPKAYITREAFAQVLNNVLSTYVRTAGEYSADAAGNVMVNVPGVVLKNMKIKGDLIVGEGVGSGELTLDGAEVTGRLVIRGGGAHSVILKNNSTVGSARIGKTGDGGIRLRTEEGCRIEAVYVADGRDDIILDGEFNQIVVDTDATVILADARVTGLTLKAESADVRLEGETQVSAVLVAKTAEGAKLTLEEEAKVASLDSAAENVTIGGDGTLETARVSGDNTQVNTEGTSLTVAEDVQGVTENNKSVEAGETVVTEKPVIGGETGSGSESESGSESGTVIPPYIPPADPAVYTVVLEGGTRTPFATLAEAIAEAEKTVYTQTEGEGDEAYTLRYHPRVEMTGTGSVTDLVLPAGYSLRIYGDLTISGSVRLEDNLVDETAKTVTLYSRVIVCAPSGVARTAKGAFGFASDCILQLSAEAPADPEIYNGLFVAPDGEDLYMTVLWADVRVNGNLSLGAFHVMSGEDKLNTLTVPAGVTFDLGFCSSSVNLLVEEGATLNLTDCLSLFDGSTLENRGKVILQGRLELNRESYLRNYGTLEAEAYQEEYEGGTVLFDSDIDVHEGSLLENSGTLILRSGSEEDWDVGACLRVYDGGSLVNTGKLENHHRIEVYEGGSLENAGTLENYRQLYMGTGETQTVTRNGGEPEVEGNAAPGSFVNTGTLTVGDEAELQVEGGIVTLGGSVTNYGQLEFRETAERNRTLVLESTQGEPEEGEDWWGEDWDNPGCYWKVLQDETTAENTSPCSVTLTGALDNFGWMNLISAAFTVETGATLNNRSSMDVWQQEDWEFPDLTFSAPRFTVKGTFNTGAVTAVGEQDDGSWARFSQSHGTFENQGKVVNNGELSTDLVAYVQAENASMVTYNTAGLSFFGGSLTVPSVAEFRNEGYMNITDPYGTSATGEVMSPCDLSGFPTFFTTWNQMGNDSHWCNYTAEVYDLAGFKAANEEQAKRIDTWEREIRDERYNQLRFVGNITLDEDTTLDLFHDYWLNGHNEYRWEKWDEETQRNVSADENDPDAWYGMEWVGSTLTVPQGVTLTVAENNALRVDGRSDCLTWFDPDILEVKGRLVIRDVPEDADYGDPGLVEIWSFGSFVCTGTVENSGVFEVRYHEHGTWNEDTWDADYDGTFFRPYEFSLPEHAVKAAEVRTETGFRNAAAGDEYHRLYIREDCCVTLTQDVTVSADINVEPGSGFIVNHGAALTLAGHLYNGGDISIFGGLTVTEAGSIDNEQNIEIGVIGSSETAALRIYGSLESRYGSRLYTYESGSVSLEDGAELFNWPGDALNLVLNGVPRRAARITFPEDITLTSSSEERIDYDFNECEFLGNVTVLYAQGDEELWAQFCDNAVFADGKKVIVKAAGDVTDKNAIIDKVTLNGVSGLDIQTDISVRTCSCEEGSYTLNGITVETEWVPSDPEDNAPENLSGNCQVRFETHVEDPQNVFDSNILQIDSDLRTNVRLSGSLKDSSFDELRLQQGCIDAEGLDTEQAVIAISSQWDSPTIVNLGANASAEVNVGKNTCDGYDRNGEPYLGRYNGVEIVAGDGANLLLKDSWMEWGGDNYCGSSITVNGYQIDPHIFGCRTESTHGGVYIGIKDSAVTYDPILGEEHLQFSFGGDTGSEVKTHLYKLDNEHTWFTAGPQANPHLDLTVTLPGTVTVTVENIPVKPEWEEPQD